jgi:hypothetical protein
MGGIPERSDTTHQRDTLTQSVSFQLPVPQLHMGEERGKDGHRSYLGFKVGVQAKTLGCMGWGVYEQEDVKLCVCFNQLGGCCTLHT